jgi:hypothetical protein
LAKIAIIKEKIAEAMTFIIKPKTEIIPGEENF